jgi:hypothetical protein
MQNTFDKKKKIYEMRLELHNYAVYISTEKICIKFYNNKINSLERHDTAWHYRILHNVVQLLSQDNHNIPNHPHIRQLHQRNNKP